MGDGGGRASRGYDELERRAEPLMPAPGARHPFEPAPLVDILLDADPERSAEALRRIVRRGADRFVDVMLPEAARLLGEMWLDDRVGFAEVTVASARLQNALREVDPGPEAADAPLLAVVVPEGETHTLGAAVAAWRLRRAGASVMLLVGRTTDELETAVAGGDLGVVCVSSSAGGDGGALAPLVARLRRASGAPVLLGGSILEVAEAEMLRAASGADGVGRDPEEALALASGRRT